MPVEHSPERTSPGENSESNVDVPRGGNDGRFESNQGGAAAAPRQRNTLDGTMSQATLVNLSNLPDPWDVESDDLETSWETFRTEFELFGDMTQLDQQTEAIRRAVLAKSIGARGRLWCRAINVDFKTLSVEEIIEKIEKRVLTSTSQTLRDFNFWHDDLKQRKNETFDGYLSRVLEAANKCEFRDREGSMSVRDRLIRSRLIIGICDERVKESLLASDSSLDELIAKCRARESGRLNAKLMLAKSKPPSTADDTTVIAAIHGGNNNNNRRHSRSVLSCRQEALQTEQRRGRTTETSRL